jgi:UDP-sugar diphosphatase
MRNVGLMFRSTTYSITSYIAGVGTQGATQTLFFAQVDESMKSSDGGGLAIDGEAIELLGLPLKNVDAFVVDASIPKSSGIMFGLIWAKAHLVQSS